MPTFKTEFLSGIFLCLFLLHHSSACSISDAIKFSRKSLRSLCVSLLYLQEQWSLTDFVVSKITRTCVASCTPTTNTDLLAATASSTSIVTCVAPPGPATDRTGKSALQCYQCFGSHTDAACKAAQSSSSPKSGGIDVAAGSACTHCYVSRVCVSRELSGYM